MNKFEEIQKALNEVSPIPVNLPKLYLLGDTGAGKTTIIRKVLGIEESKFPTTRQTRTTVATTEYVIRNGGSYDVTIILKSKSEVEIYVDEIIKEAIARFCKDKSKEKIARDIRETSDQRFRLYYLLSEDYMGYIAQRIYDLSPSIDKKIEQCKLEFPNDNEETDFFVELAIDEMAESYKSICSEIIAEIQLKVKDVCDGKELGPSLGIYKYSSTDKASFIAKCKKILSSDKDSISPVIEHARICGNLKATGILPNIEAVIIDGEGIGHDTRETGQLSSRHHDYFYTSDAILLIEESKKPFVAGGKNALKFIYKRGYKDKLLILFTKLDEVEPYGIDEPNNDDRKEEVEKAFYNVKTSLKDNDINVDLPDDRIYYFGGMKDDGLGESTINQLNSLFSKSKSLSRFESSFVKPNYDFEMLSGHLTISTQKFNELYNNRLREQHWKTIQAFNRRMIMGGETFRMFAPVTDFEDIITNDIKKFIDVPSSWSEEISDSLKEQSLNCIRREFNKSIIDFAIREVIFLPHDDWNRAFKHSGWHSTFRRRHDIEAIFKKSVPLLNDSDNAKRFKDNIKAIIEKAIANCEKA